MRVLTRAFFFFLFMLISVPSQAKAETIGVAMDKLNTFMLLLRDAIQESADNRPDVTVDVAVAEKSKEKQIQQIKGFIAQKVDAIIVIPVTNELSIEIASMAADAEIPLVFMNRLPPTDKLPGKFAIVASNEAVAGRLQMRILASMMNGEGNVAILRGPDGHSGATFRTAGNKEVMAKYPKMRLVKEAVAGWSKDKGEAIVTSWLNAGVKIDAVVANNDDMAIGAIRAFQKADIPMSEVYVAGVDATPAALEEVEKGTMEVTIFQNARGQGETALKDAVKLARGQPAQLYDWVPFELVTAKVLSNYKK